ncbi:hypothetical protein F2P81_010071 [Scophthalmus maximus]|uniref:Uncharacterized protein n=1 Tax=Scophthalmus maximus TaxID=52904 RepID=A0A6A4SUR4_SCOMX|nr:hypothetical protein F2P81_010071 [Scophthalmus maximus]
MALLVSGGCDAIRGTHGPLLCRSMDDMLALYEGPFEIKAELMTQRPTRNWQISKNICESVSPCCRSVRSALQYEYRHESVTLTLTRSHHFGVGPFRATVIVTKSIIKYRKVVAFNYR